MLKRDGYIKAVRRPYPPLFGSLMLHGFSNEKNFHGILTPKFKMINKAKVAEVWYYPKAEVELGSRLSYQEWKQPTRLKAVKKEFARREKNLLKAAKKNFIEYSQAYEHFMPAVALVWITEFSLLDDLKAILGKKLDQLELEKLLDGLNIPLQDNYYKKEQYDLLQAKNLNQHISKYSWLFSRYGEVKPYRLHQAKKALAKIDKREFLKNWTQTKQHAKKSVALAKKLLPQQHKPIIDLMQFLVYYRTHRTDVLNQSQFLAYPMLRHFAKELGLSYYHLLYCTKEEVLGKLPPLPIIKERMKGHALLNEEGKITCLIGKDRKKLEGFFSEAGLNVKSFSGNIACTGKARGKAKIIFSSKDFAKIRRGDILVTSMTNPHMVPILKKAAAIITDEGGITSHAAIISRELKIPCIIGTKIATQVLKDGDIIEVDANKGSATIIKRNI